MGRIARNRGNKDSKAKCAADTSGETPSRLLTTSRRTCGVISRGAASARCGFRMTIFADTLDAITDSAWACQ